MVRMVTEDVETTTPGNYAGAIISDTLQDLCLCLEDIIRYKEIRHGRLSRDILRSSIAGHQLQTTLEVSPPVVLLTFQALYLLCR